MKLVGKAMEDIKKIFIALGDFAFGMAYNLAVFWMLARVLAVESFGALSFTLALSSLIMPFIVLSFPNFILLPKGYSMENKTYVSIMYCSVTLILAISILASIFYILAYEIWLIVYMIQSMIVATEVIPRTILKNTVASRYAMISVGASVIRLCLIGIVYFTFPSYLISSVITINVFVALAFWTQISASRSDDINLSSILSDAWGFSRPLLVSALLVLLYTRLDQLMIGMYLDHASLAEYSVAVKVSDGLSSVWVAVQAFYLQSLLGSGRAYTRIVLLAWLYGLIVLAFTTLFGQELVSILFGEQYQSSFSVLQKLSFGTVFIALNSIGAIWLQKMGLVFLTPARSFAGLVINAFGNYLLIPLYGIDGAAMATVGSQFAVCFIAPLLIRKMRKLIRVQLLVDRG